MEKIKDIIYFDYNSTTPVDERVIEAMIPFFSSAYANPSSAHGFGKLLNKEIRTARESIANLINAAPEELIFTSGATESINLAIKGVAEGYSGKGKHIISVLSEHKAVLDTLKDLESRGFEVTYLPVQASGLINLADLESSLRRDTILVVVMLANNETGVIQPIHEITDIAHKFETLVLTDATQAVGKIKVDVIDMGVDLLCFSGHKMYAPKGIGALYINQKGGKIKLIPQVFGGGQELGLRSGTLNVPGIKGFEKACEIAVNEMEKVQQHVSNLVNNLEERLLKLPNTKVNGISVNRLFNTTNICFQGQDASVLIGRLKDVAISSGSACSSSIIEPSHVLKAMGLTNEDALASIRFSLGKYNTQEEVEKVSSKLFEIVQSTQEYAERL
jgi:cysteine desulfurase